MNVSISDIQTFSRCRRQWDFVSPNRQSLERATAGFNINLIVGTGVHLGLAAQANGDDWDLEFEHWAENEALSVERTHQERTGMSPDDEEMQPLYDAQKLVYALLSRYFDRYGYDNPLGGAFRTFGVEQSFTVPIPGTEHTLVGTLDRLVEDESTGNVWIVEYKTFGTKPNLDALQFKPQFVAYCYVASALLGKPVAGVLYDGISRKLPKPPKALKGGALSTAYLDSTDHQAFVDAIADHNQDAEKYADVLTILEHRDTQSVTPFYARMRVAIAPAQIRAFAERLPVLANAMYADPDIWPVFRLEGCWDCGVRDLCTAYELGEDVDGLIAAFYRKGEGNSSFRRASETAVELEYAAA